MQVTREPLGLYVHLPFCRHRCAYCDFAIIAGRLDLLPRYAELLFAEIGRAGARLGRPSADSVHFGGGTPSLVPAELIGRSLDALGVAFDLGPVQEIALEANPEDVTEEKARVWRRAGVTRVTVGVQALAPEGLAAIGRPGTVASARAALAALSGAGFRSVGADLIFGRPGQGEEGWRREVEEVVRLGLQHLSCYALELDAPTPLARAVARGAAPAPDPDRAAAMYEAAHDVLSAAGFHRYEVSNWARPGHASRHNLKYWSDLPYLGLGLAAASYVEGRRWVNPRRLRDYERMVRAGAWPEEESYDPVRRAGEALIFGLRREEGVDLEAVARRHGEPAVAARIPALDRAERDGLVLRDGSRVRLTERGRMIADELFVWLL